MAKERIDTLLVKKGLCPSREKAKLLVLSGEVYANGERVDKCDRRFDENVKLEVRGRSLRYVSYGGIKLEKALEDFKVDVKGKKAVDVGASTGGFTDCLLAHGASFVYAIDVGKNQLDQKLRSDPRVKSIEGFNARYLTYETIGEYVDVATIDVSFISLKKILPAVIQVVSPGGKIIALVKPQFEAKRNEVKRGGIVKDPEVQKRVLEEMKIFGESIGLKFLSYTQAPKEKERKNTEYFILWEK